MNGKTIIADCFKPYVFTSVFVPVFLSASASVISFVIDPPIKKIIARNPMVRGNGSKELPNTLQLASIPSSPRGIPTHSWLINSLSLHLGGIEYVTVKNVISSTNKRNIEFIKKAMEIEDMYSIMDISSASFDDTIPFGIGLYGFDILSVFKSVT